VLDARELGKGRPSPFPELEDMPLAIKILKEADLSAKDAWEIWQTGFDWVEADQRPDNIGEDQEGAFLQYVREKVDLLKRRQASGKVENRTGFLMEAIRKNYANPDFEAAKKQQEAHRRREDQAAAEKERERLRDEKVVLERARQEEAHALCKKMFAAEPALAGEAVAVLLTEVRWFKKQYEPAKNALENYQQVPALWIEMDRFLEEHQPEHFRAIQEKYDGQLEAIDQTIEALERVHV
jgi:hypothetical protein